MVRTLRKEDWFHADGFPIAVERREPQQPFGLHAHEFSEMVLITGGRGEHVTGEDRWDLRTGDVFVISGSRPHDYLNMDDLRLINVMFDQSSLDYELLDLPSLPGYHALFLLEPAWRRRHAFESRLRLSPRDMGVAVGLVDQLEAELANRESGFEFLATACFMQLVGFLSRCYGRSQQADSRALLKMAQTITHLETHFHEEIKLDTLVEMSGMSKRSFLREFEAAVGCPPIAYTIQLRLARAAKLLKGSPQSVTEIAYAVGFRDGNYFARQFRKHYRISPRAYRQRSLASTN